MIREGLKNLAAGANPMVMRRGIQKATEAAVAEIRANSQPVSGSQDIARVGTISSGDELIGRLIAEAMEKVSQNGVITVETRFGAHWWTPPCSAQSSCWCAT